jgi:hypothetical protein
LAAARTLLSAGSMKRFFVAVLLLSACGSADEADQLEAKYLTICQPGAAETGPPLTCEPGGATGAVCIGGHDIESVPMCCAGTAADYLAAFPQATGSYADTLAAMRADEKTCGAFPGSGVGVVTTGVCGAYHYIELQGLGIGVVHHRFYNQAGTLVGAQTRDDVARGCYQSYGLIPECTLQQCDVVCSSRYTC